MASEFSYTILRMKTLEYFDRFLILIHLIILRVQLLKFDYKSRQPSVRTRRPAIDRPSTPSADLPPLKWSILRYDFSGGWWVDGEEAAYSGRDCCEATARRRADGTGLVGC